MKHSSRFSRVRIICFVCLFAQTVSLATAADWTRFRGPNGSGVNANCTVPVPWAPENVRWNIELEGTGNGSPVVFDGRVYLMSSDQESATRFLQAFDLSSGDSLWTKQFEGQTHHLHSRSTYASSSPCVSNQGVYFTWGGPDGVVLIALTHDGDPLWRRDLGRFVSQHGYGASPVVFDDTVILFNSQAAQQLPPGVEPGESRVMAFEAATGRDKWATGRKTTRACYGVPALVDDPQSGEKVLLFANTGDGIFALRLADGEPLWNKPVFKQRCVSCPVIVGDLVIATEGSGAGSNRLFAVNYKDGEHEIAFEIDRFAPYVPGVVARDNKVFLWSDRGMVSCVETPTGNVLWTKRVSNPPVSSSPVIAGDKLIGISESGTVNVVRASETFEELGVFELGEPTRATPVIGDDYILVRTAKHLQCIEAK